MPEEPTDVMNFSSHSFIKLKNFKHISCFKKNYVVSLFSFSFQYFIESKAYKNITIHIYIDEISSFQVYTSQRVWAEASLSKSPYQSIVAINLVFC